MISHARQRIIILGSDPKMIILLDILVSPGVLFCIMPRLQRIQYENAIYHVIAKGNRAQDIFLDDRDREKFLTYLKEARTKFDLEIFCFALLDNHFHISLRTRRPNLSKAMQWLQTSYSVYFNLRHRASGHLFAGRYKSILVENERYLIALSCYVHLNPVKAGIVKDARTYRWSSCRVYTDLKAGFEWLSTGLILDLFGRHLKKQKQMYRETLEDSAISARRIDKTVKRGFLLGGREFRAQINKKLRNENEKGRHHKLAVDTEQIIEAVARHFICSREDVVQVGSGKTNTYRDAAVYLIRKHTYLRRKEIGEYFRMSPAAVGKCLERMRAKMKGSELLEEKTGAIIEELSF